MERKENVWPHINGDRTHDFRHRHRWHHNTHHLKSGHQKRRQPNS